MGGYHQCTTCPKQNMRCLNPTRFTTRSGACVECFRRLRRPSTDSLVPECNDVFAPRFVRAIGEDYSEPVAPMGSPANATLQRLLVRDLTSMWAVLNDAVLIHAASEMQAHMDSLPRSEGILHRTTRSVFEPAGAPPAKLYKTVRSPEPW